MPAQYTTLVRTFGCICRKFAWFWQVYSLIRQFSQESERTINAFEH